MCTAMRAAVSGRLRWAVNIEEWRPEGEASGQEFQFLLSLIQEDDDRERVMKYRTLQDRKRALLSRLMCRRASAAVLGLDSFAEIEIGRTKGKKPFLKRPRPADAALSNFNFNISHEGDWVVLASEPVCVCGVDVAAPPECRPGARCPDMSKAELTELTREEWEAVRQAGLLEPASVPKALRGYDVFQRHWSAKEAFVKARGDGIAFDMGRASFQFDEQDSQGDGESFLGTATVDGELASRWLFFQDRFSGNHWITVARGPTTDVVDANGAFMSTLAKPTERFTVQAWAAELRAESPGFEIIPVGFLVPGDRMSDYVASGGLAWEQQADVEVEVTAGPHSEPGPSGAGAAEGPQAAQIWKVVGGADKGGIIVREARELASPQAPERLATGALVRELALVGERLQYERLEGDGPLSGWVSLSLKGVPLVTRI